MSAEAVGQKRAVVVLGMHRSGTSAISRALSFYGYRQPRDLMPEQPDNPLGFWEPMGVVRLNNQILETLGGAWDRPGPFLAQGQGLDESRRTVAAAVESRWLESACGVLTSSFAGAGAIVVKDPRLTLLQPLWDRALAATGYRSAYVLIYRNPLEVAASLRDRNGIGPRRAMQLWVHYVLEALEGAKCGKLQAVLSYPNLLADPERVLDGVAATLQAPTTSLTSEASAQLRGFVVAKHRHHSTPNSAPLRSPVIARVVKDAWSLLCEWNARTEEQRTAAIAGLRSAYDDAVLLGGAPTVVPAEQLEAVKGGRAEASTPAPGPGSGAAHGHVGQPGHPPLLLHYHLFKNAGSSVDEMLRQNFGSRWVEAEFHGSGQRSNVAHVEAFLRSRGDLLAFSSHTALLPLPELDGRRVLPILFIRHPIDRLKSAYTFERKQNADTFGARLARTADFAGYIRELLSSPNNRQARNFQACRLAFHEPAEGGTEHERAMRTLDRLPFVGLVEAYDLSLERLRETYGPLVPELRVISVRKNVTRAEPKPIEAKLQEIQRELGDQLYADLWAANASDIELHRHLSQRYGLA